MSDIRNRMERLMEEQADESVSEEPKLKELASHVVLGALQILPEDLEDAVDELSTMLKKLGANKSVLRTALSRFKVGNRAKTAAKKLVKDL